MLARTITPRIALLPLITSVVGIPAHAERVYQLVDYPALQNGHTLSGTITTTDTAAFDGVLQQQEVINWQWHVSGPNTLAATGGTPERVENIIITPNSIEMPLISYGGLQLRQGPLTSQGAYEPALLWIHTLALDPNAGLVQPATIAGYGVGDIFVSFWSASLANVASQTWVIATVVPEPSAAILYLVGYLGLLLTGERRVRPIDDLL